MGAPLPITARPRKEETRERMTTTTFDPTRGHASPAIDADTRLQLRRLAERDERADFAADVARGLRAKRKQLPPKYFYDALGSRLFQAICHVDEYYLTRAEDGILSRHADEIVRAAAADGKGNEGVAAPLTLLELGSGSADKTRHLIEALLRRQDELLYLPVDISATALEASAPRLLQAYPSLRIEAYAGDYDTALAHLRVQREREDNEGDTAVTRRRTLAVFLGSNLGNFDRSAAASFLQALRFVLRAGDGLLLGVELKKDAATLEAANDDPLGVTAAFNLNLLARINRELEADFDLRRFLHVARYDADAGRVEMYVESTRDQVVRVRALDLEASFAAGERMHTEDSYKYDADDLTRLAARAGFKRAGMWTDEARRFGSNLFVAV